MGSHEKIFGALDERGRWWGPCLAASLAEADFGPLGAEFLLIFFYDILQKVISSSRWRCTQKPQKWG